MSFPRRQLAVRVVLSGLSQPAVRPYASVISAAKAYTMHEPSTIQRHLPYGRAKCFPEEENMFVNPEKNEKEVCKQGQPPA